MTHVEIRPSAAAIKRREALSTSPFWQAIFPNTIIDREHGMVDARNFVSSGGSAAFFTIHPSIEDVPRLAALAGNYPEFATRQWLVPTAIHQMLLMKLIAEPFYEIEAVPLVTEHSMKHRTYTWREIKEHLEKFIDRTVWSLGHNNVIGIANQADQDDHLRPPKNKLLKHIMDRTDAAGVDNFGIIFLGIDIPGRDITHARSVPVRRYPYVFTASRFFTKEEAKKEAKDAGLPIDMWAYHQQVRLSPPEYVLK